MIVWILYIATFFNINLDASITSGVTMGEVVNSEETIQWYTWEEAHELSKTAPKKIFIDMYTNWCGWCKKMDKTTFQDPTIVKYLNDNFYPVKFNAERKKAVVFQDRTFEFMASGRRGVHQLAYALLDGRLGYPAFVTLDETYARIMISPGYKKVDQLMKELVFAKEEKYMEMTFDDYLTKAD